MKKRNIITTTLLAILALAGCQKNDDLGNSPSRPVQIIVAIKGQTQTRAQINPDGSGAFEDGDLLSLLYGNMEPRKILLTDYTIGTPKLYWEEVLNTTSGTAEHEYAFMAWYPKFVLEDLEKGKADYDVAGAKDDTHRDLLMTKAVKVNYGEPVTLTFQHVMHRLVIKLKSHNHTAEQLQTAKVQLKNFKTHAHVIFGDGAKEAKASSPGTSAYPVARGANTSFIVAPQDLTTGEEMLRIEVGGKTFVYKVPAKFTGSTDSSPCRLQGGKTLTLNLSIGSNGEVTLETDGISAWGDGGSSSGTAIEANGNGTPDE